MSIISFIRNLFNCITGIKPFFVNYSDGSQHWYLNGKRHREDGPAIIRADGSEEWYLNGKRHREDGPAVIDAWGTQWWLNGFPHRENGSATIWANASKYWFLNDVEIEYNVYHKSKIHFEEIKFTIKDGL